MTSPGSATAVAPARPEPRRFWTRRADTIFLGLGLVALVWVVSRYPLAELAGICARMGDQVLLTLLVAVGWNACNSAGMTALFEGRIRFRTLLWVRLAAEGYNSLLAGVGGEPFRIRTLSREAPPDLVLATVIRDKVLDHTTGYLLSAAFIAVGVARYTLPVAMRDSLAAYAAVVAVVSILGSALVLTRLPGRLVTVAVKIFGGSTTPPEPVARRVLARALPWYFAGRLLGVFEIALLLHLLGLGGDPLRAGFIDGVLNAAGTLGFMIPQAIGVYEGTSAFLFKTFGFAGAAGVAFALVRRARMLTMSLMGVALHWAGRRWRD